MANSQKWDSSAVYQNQSLAFLDKLAARYASSPALIAIGILNKPTVRYRQLPQTGSVEEHAYGVIGSQNGSSS